MKHRRINLRIHLELEKKIFIPFSPSPSAEEAHTGNSLQAGAVHPGVLGEPPWPRTRRAGAGWELSSPCWEGGGEQLAGPVSPQAL